MADPFYPLAASARIDSASYLRNFESRWNEIREILNSENKLKCNIRRANHKRLEDLIRCACIFNDITTLNLPTGRSPVIQLYKQEYFKKNFGDIPIMVTLSNKTIEENNIDIENPALYPALMWREDEYADSLISNIAPLIEGGHLLVEPIRAITALTTKVHEDGGRTWVMIDADSRASLDTWTELDAGKSPIPLYMGQPGETAQDMLDLVVPFLQGVSFDDLALILADEKDSISGLRQAIKKVVEAAKTDQRELSSVREDVLRPATDALERRFNKIGSLGRLRIGGAAVSFAAMSLVALATGGLGMMAGIVGAGGAGAWMVKEIGDYAEKMAALKDDPFYLLWRCRTLG